MADVNFFVGLDTQGDNCLYVSVLKRDGSFKRYLTEDELETLVQRLYDAGFVTEGDCFK